MGELLTLEFRESFLGEGALNSSKIWRYPAANIGCQVQGLDCNPATVSVLLDSWVEVFWNTASRISGSFSAREMFALGYGQTINSWLSSCPPSNRSDFTYALMLFLQKNMKVSKSCVMESVMYQICLSTTIFLCGPLQSFRAQFPAQFLAVPRPSLWYK